MFYASGIPSCRRSYFQDDDFRRWKGARGDRVNIDMDKHFQSSCIVKVMWPLHCPLIKDAVVTQRFADVFQGWSVYNMQLRIHMQMFVDHVPATMLFDKKNNPQKNFPSV